MIGIMALRDKEAIAAKLNGYAEKLSGFAILQSISFVLAFQNKDFREGVQFYGFNRALNVAGVTFFFYLSAAILCMVGDHNLIGTPKFSTPEGKWIALIRAGQIIIILISGWINAYTLAMFN